MVNRVTISIIAGASVGSVQTPLIRQFVDDPMATTYAGNPSGPKPWLIGQLKNFGSPSATLGMGIGGGALAYAVYGMYKAHRPEYVYGALTYGIPAFVGGLLSGLFPTTAWATAVKADPPLPGTAAADAGSIVVRRRSAAGGLSPFHT